MHNKKISSLVAVFAIAVSLFSAVNFAQAETMPYIIINEVQISGENSNDEFIELFNPADTSIDLKGYKLAKKTKTGSTESVLVSAAKFSGTIQARGYFLIAHPNYKDEISADLAYSSSTYSVSKDNTIFLYNKDGVLLDEIGFGEVNNANSENSPAPNSDANQSIERTSFIDTDNNASDFSINTSPTPKNSTLVETDTEDDSDDDNNIPDDPEKCATFSKNIRLNEILPNPKNDEEKEEFIELVNGDSELVDLFGWTIRDGSKTRKYVFKEHIELESGKYFAVYRPDSKITLNNSSESVTLYNPQGEITSSVSWDKSTKDASYGFDGKKWKWSKYLTPNKKNKFDSEPSVKIVKPKRAFKGLLTKFGAKAKDKETKKLKYAWDFGDGKKSYLAETSHKYLDTGKYTVTLAITDYSQTVEKSFTLQVKKYPRPDIEIVKIVPNPAGKDSEGEIVGVRNNSKKKIDLAGWKIATGAGKNIYNHPIIGEIGLGPGETKAITREICKFSLNNKAGKVSLVMPDTKTADAVEYEKGKIAEDEAYAKIDGEWQWITPEINNESSDSGDEVTNEVAPTSENENMGEVLGATDENIFASPNFRSRFTSEDAYIFLNRINFAKPFEKEMSYRPATDPSSSIAYLIASLI